MCNRGPHQPGDLREASYLDRVWGGSIFYGGETPRCEGVLGRGEGDPQEGLGSGLGEVGGVEQC